MNDDHINPWKTVNTKEVYDNPWIKITHRDVINPSDRPGIYGVVHFKNLAIGIIPLDEHLNTWLVGQYRYPINQYSWEIPEGGCPIGTSPLNTAKRELMEETGISAHKWTELSDVYLSNSVTDEFGKIFLAQELSFGEAEPEETEQLQIKKVPFQTAFEMVLNSQITDSLSVIGLMKIHILLEKGSI